MKILNYCTWWCCN